MKKFTAILVIIIMSSLMFMVGCSGSEQDSSPDIQSEPASDVQTEPDNDTQTELAADVRYLPVQAEFFDYDPDDPEEPISDDAIHCTYEYTYDEHGNITECFKHELASEMTDTYENTYRDDGTLWKVKATIARDPEENGEIVYSEYLFEYDETGKLISGGVPESSDTDGADVTYTEDGLLSHVEYEYYDGLSYWDYDYYLREDGLVDKAVKHYDTVEYYIYKYTYDMNNKNTEVTQEQYADYLNNIWNGFSAW